MKGWVPRPAPTQPAAADRPTVRADNAYARPAVRPAPATRRYGRPVRPFTDDASQSQYFSPPSGAETAHSPETSYRLRAVLVQSAVHLQTAPGQPAGSCRFAMVQSRR